MQDSRRATPRTDTVLADPRVRETVDRLGDALVKRQVAAVLDRCRAGEVAPDAVVDEVLHGLPAAATTLRPVLNATGVVVHTNLGRAPLSPAAVEAVRLASGATDVELDLSTGRRGRRGRGALAALAEAVPEAGGVHVVNNGAAALALVTCALAMGREVIVSRGELVEIGGGFRLPDIMRGSGAVLREVGTTNRTRAADYAAAISDRTAAILRVHASNFRIEGFTERPALADLVGLAQRFSIPILEDQGSGWLGLDVFADGAFPPATRARLAAEPSVRDSVRAGVDIVAFSGDKLLGGPQAGLLVGRAEWLARVRTHPLMRAVRVDKITYAGLHATLGAFTSGRAT